MKGSDVKLHRDRTVSVGGWTDVGTWHEAMNGKVWFESIAHSSDEFEVSSPAMTRADLREWIAGWWVGARKPVSAGMREEVAR